MMLCNDHNVNARHTKAVGITVKAMVIKEMVSFTAENDKAKMKQNSTGISSTCTFHLNPEQERTFSQPMH